MECMLCPRRCGADREKTLGFCDADNRIRIARAMPHMWEEPPISGTRGSGTVFFSGCSLKCDFCQNMRISHGRIGKAVTPERLYDIFLELKAAGCHNINLVTADHYIPQLLPVLRRFKADVPQLPIILNTSSYITVKAADMLSDTVDVFLADFKFMNAGIAAKYCAAPDYPEVAKAAIERMVRAAGRPVFENGLIKRGVIVRVLVMPGNIIDAKAVLRYLHSRYGDDIYISIMGQYVPMPECRHRELSVKLKPSAYRSTVRYAQHLGITHGFIQEISAADGAYIPDFNLQGV